MPRWIRRLFGLACCGEYTPWEPRMGVFVRTPEMEEFLAGGPTKVEYTRYWQERRCRRCGKVQQQVLSCPADGAKLVNPYQETQGS